MGYKPKDTQQNQAGGNKHQPGKPFNKGKKTFKNHNQKLDNFNWKYKKPVDYVKFFSDKIFRNPDILNKKEKGIAIWYPKKNETRPFKM